MSTELFAALHLRYFRRKDEESREYFIYTLVQRHTDVL